MSKRKLTVLVTGALGHIGSRLIREFDLSLVRKVVMLDNLATQRYASLFNLPDKFDYEFIEEDVRTADMDSYLKGVDAVIHLAALTDAEKSHTRPEEVESVNLEGLKKVADACFRKKIKLLFSSTTSVYGSQAARVDENCRELVPQSPYAQSKLEAEQHLGNLKSRGLRYVICRFGTIFGPSVGMRFHTAVNKFLWQAINGKPITVWKTAWEQKRPYLDLTDCVAAINFILEKDLFDGEIYNVLSINLTVKDIVETIKQFVPELKVEFVESQIMNQLSYEVDDAKFKSLGFASSGNLEKGVLDSIKLLKRIKVNAD